MQHIAHILLVKPLTPEIFVKHMVLRPLQHFLPEMIFGYHIERRDVGQRIVVYIGNIGPHGRVGRMRQKRAYGFGKRPVPVVHVQVIILDKVVGNVEIRPGVPVHIANDHTESEAKGVADDARRFAHVRKRSAVVPVQFVADQGVASTPHIVYIEAGQTPDRMIQQIYIQVAIPVVIEQGRVGRVGRIVETVFRRSFGKRPVPVVDVQGVPAGIRAHPARFAHIDVQMSIPIDIRHRHAGRPAEFACKTCLLP